MNSNGQGFSIVASVSSSPFQSTTRTTDDLGGVDLQVGLNSIVRNSLHVSSIKHTYRNRQTNEYLRRTDLTSDQLRREQFVEINFEEIYRSAEINRMRASTLSSGNISSRVSYTDRAGQLFKSTISSLNHNMPFISPTEVEYQCHPSCDLNLEPLLDRTSWGKRPHLKALLKIKKRPCDSTSNSKVHPGKIAFYNGNDIFHATSEVFKDEYSIANFMVGLMIFYDNLLFLPVVNLPAPVLGIDSDSRGNVCSTVISSDGKIISHYQLNTKVMGEFRSLEYFQRILDYHFNKGNLSRHSPFIIHYDGKIIGGIRRELESITSKYPLAEIIEIPKMGAPLFARIYDNGIEHGQVGDYAIFNQNQGAIVSNAQNRERKCPRGTFVNKLSGSLSIQEHLDVVYQLCEADAFSLFHKSTKPQSVRLAADQPRLARNLIKAMKNKNLI